MRRNLILLFAVLFASQLIAQKIKLTGGDLSPLKGQKRLDISFTYDENMRVGKMTEVAYIEKKVAEAEEDEPGRGEKWREMWYEDRPVHFEPKFLELLNDYVDEAIISPASGDAQYKMIVNTVFIEPGFNVGVAKKNASINLEIYIVPVGKPENKLTTISITNSPGRSWGYGDYDTGIRVGEAYAKAGKELGKFFEKKKAF